MPKDQDCYMACPSVGVGLWEVCKQKEPWPTFNSVFAETTDSSCAHFHSSRMWNGNTCITTWWKSHFGFLNLGMMVIWGDKSKERPLEPCLP